MTSSLPPEIEEIDPHLWEFIPPREWLPEPSAWIRRTAEGMAGSFDPAGVDRELRERLETMLALLVAEPLSPGFAWRFLFMVDPNQGGVLFDVAFLRPDGPWPDVGRRLVGADLVMPLGSTVETFVEDDVEGITCLGFEGVPAVISAAGPSLDEPTPETTIIGRSSTVVRRELPGMGLTDVLMHGESGFLESLLMASRPVQLLLTGTGLSDLIGAAAQSRT